MYDICMVEITYKDGRMGFYEVRDAYEHIDITGITYLAMMRLKDNKYGYIPMDILKGYKILEDEVQTSLLFSHLQ